MLLSFFSLFLKKIKKEILTKRENHECYFKITEVKIIKTNIYNIKKPYIGE